MRLFVVALLYMIAIDLAGAGLIASFAPREEGPIFFLLLAALWVVPIGIGLWRFVTFWIGYYVFLKRALAREYAARFIRGGFPSGGAYLDALSYLSAVIDDESLSQETKLRAAVMVGELKILRQQSPWRLCPASEMAFVQAMTEHRGNGWFSSGNGKTGRVTEW